MGPGRDRTRDPWICSQTRICSLTRYRLRYAARSGYSDLATNIRRNQCLAIIISGHSALAMNILTLGDSRSEQRILWRDCALAQVHPGFVRR